MQTRWTITTSPSCSWSSPWTKGMRWGGVWHAAAACLSASC
ncbi:hypothetical protein HaLaN_26019, partial [Haematococcus lacustris]